MPDANLNTTNIEPHQTMHIQSGPSPDEQAARAAAVAPKTDSPDDLSTPANNPRADAMAAIYAKRNQMIEDELGLASRQSAESAQGDEPAEPATEQPSAAASNAPAQEPRQRQLAQPDAQPTIAPLPDVIPINIGGTIMNIGRDELLRLAQTGLQATQVYNDATQMREQAQRLIGAGQQAPQQQQPAARAQPAPQAAQPVPVFDEARAREISKRLNYGSEEEQARALSDLGTTIQQAVSAQLASAQPAAVNPNEMVQNVSRAVMENMQQHQTLQTIAHEFQDVFADAELSYAAGYRANLIAQSDAQLGRNRPKIDVFREVLTDIRNKYIAPRGNQPVQPSAGQAPANTNPSVQAATPVAQQMSDRIERKRTAPQPPVAANVRSKGEPQKSYPSNSEIVSQMRKSRGQSAF